MKAYLPPRREPLAAIVVVIEVESPDDGPLEIRSLALGPNADAAFKNFQRAHPKLKCLRFETPYEKPAPVTALPYETTPANFR